MASTAGVALVTGASSGIGFELARLFAEDGYDVVIAADDDGIHASADKLATTGAQIQPVQVDLRQASEVERLYRTATDGGRRLAAVALNAGTGRGGPFIDGDLGSDFNVVDLNVRSTVHLSKLVLRDMAEQGAARCSSRRRSCRRCPDPCRRCTTRRSRSSNRSPRRSTTSCAAAVSRSPR